MLCMLNFLFIFIIANITGILYTLKRILRAIIENPRAEISFSAHSVKVLFATYRIQRAEISFSVHHQGINDIFTLKSITVPSFSDCQKHKDITVKTLEGDDEMKTLQCLHFLSNITHSLTTYVCTII